jgi:hypothetical protein
MKYTWNPSTPLESRVHTWSETVKACPAHVDKEGGLHFAVVNEENTRKNISQGIGRTVSGDNRARITWEFDERRRLRVEFPTLSDEDKTATQDAIDIRFGLDKVLVERPILIVPVDAALRIGSTGSVDIFLSHIPSGLAGFDLTLILANDRIASIVDVAFPPGFPLGQHIPDPVSGPSVRVVGVDLTNAITVGASRILLVSLTVEALAKGSTAVDVAVSALDDDDGNPIISTPVSGMLSVQ